MQLFFFADVDADLGGDVPEHLDGGGIVAEGLDGVAQLHLALIHVETLSGESFGDVRGSDGAEELVVFAGFAREAERNEVQEFGLFVSGIELRGGFLREGTADPLESLHVAGGGFNGELSRQQKVAGVARLDGDHVAAMTQLFDIFLQNDLHGSSSVPMGKTLMPSHGRSGIGHAKSRSKQTSKPRRPGQAATQNLRHEPLCAASMGLGAGVPAALPANGSKAILRARLMATPSQR